MKRVSNCLEMSTDFSFILPKICDSSNLRVKEIGIKEMHLFNNIKNRIFNNSNPFIRYLVLCRDTLFYTCSHYLFMENTNIIGICSIYNNKWGRPYLCDVGILQEYRKKGYAKKFLVLLLQDLHNAGFYWLGLKVHYDSSIAQNLYLSLGFKREWGDMDADLY